MLRLNTCIAWWDFADASTLGIATAIQSVIDKSGVGHNLRGGLDRER
jgi:hypothetical protein